MNKLENKERIPYELNSEFKARTSALLSNLITDYMMKNELTLEILDIAYEKVKDVFRTDAIMRTFKEENNKTYDDLLISIQNDKNFKNLINELINKNVQRD